MGSADGLFVGDAGGENSVANRLIHSSVSFAGARVGDGIDDAMMTITSAFRRGLKAKPHMSHDHISSGTMPPIDPGDSGYCMG